MFTFCICQVTLLFNYVLAICHLALFCHVANNLTRYDMSSCTFIYYFQIIVDKVKVQTSSMLENENHIHIKTFIKRLYS